MAARVDEYDGGGLVSKSCRTLATPWDCSPPGSSVRGILQQEHWSGLPCPPPGDLPEPEIKLMSLGAHALAGKFFTTSAAREAWMGG